MINVPLSRKVEVGNLPTVQAAVIAAEQQLAKQGRVLLRSSGTEPLLRVMVEGTDARMIEEISQQLAEVVKAAVI